MTYTLHNNLQQYVCYFQFELRELKRKQKEEQAREEARREAEAAERRAAAGATAQAGSAEAATDRPDAGGAAAEERPGT